MTNDPGNVSKPETASAPLTVAEQIWEEIKDKEILMFSLPSQKISNFCQPVLIDPSRCFLLFKASSVLPSLEEAVGKNYECSAADKYIIVARKPKNAF
jgi:hypothetical protein